jgi:hypothetical protein
MKLRTRLAKSYGLTLKCVVPAEEVSMKSVRSLANFWQWISSNKLRTLTGWSD